MYLQFYTHESREQEIDANDGTGAAEIDNQYIYFYIQCKDKKTAEEIFNNGSYFIAPSYVRTNGYNQIDNSRRETVKYRTHKTRKFTVPYIFNGLGNKSHRLSKYSSWYPIQINKENCSLSKDGLKINVSKPFQTMSLSCAKDDGAQETIIKASADLSTFINKNPACNLSICGIRKDLSKYQQVNNIFSVAIGFGLYYFPSYNGEEGYSIIGVDRKILISNFLKCYLSISYDKAAITTGQIEHYLKYKIREQS